MITGKPVIRIVSCASNLVKEVADFARNNALVL